MPGINRIEGLIFENCRDLQTKGIWNSVIIQTEVRDMENETSIPRHSQVNVV
jgi:hypothetical protein